MKTSLLLLAALTGVAFTSSAVAGNGSDSKCSDCTAAPRPVTIVSPTGLPRDFAGQTVNVEFSLDREGRPQNVRVLWVDDPVVQRQLAAAVRQWKFDNLNSDPAAAAKRYILPVELKEA